MFSSMAAAVQTNKNQRIMKKNNLNDAACVVVVSGKRESPYDITIIICTLLRIYVFYEKLEELCLFVGADKKKYMQTGQVLRHNP